MSYALGDVRRGTDDPAFPSPPSSSGPPSGVDYPMPGDPPIYAGDPAPAPPYYDEPGADDPVPSSPPSGGGWWPTRTSSWSGGDTQQASMGTGSWLLLDAVVAAGIFAWRSR